MTNGELYLDQPPEIECMDCGTKLPLAVCYSNAGHYVGRFCAVCGPYDRCSGYGNFQQAEAMLQWLLANEDNVEIGVDPPLPFHRIGC